VSSFAFGGWVTLHVLSASVLHSVLQAVAQRKRRASAAQLQVVPESSAHLYYLRHKLLDLLQLV
jgi:hypothetical protein